jgi:hypothetical protein
MRLCRCCQRQSAAFLSLLCEGCIERLEIVKDLNVLTVGQEDLEGLRVLTPDQFFNKEAQVANTIESRN